MRERGIYVGPGVRDVNMGRCGLWGLVAPSNLSMNQTPKGHSDGVQVCG